MVWETIRDPAPSINFYKVRECPWPPTTIILTPSDKDKRNPGASHQPFLGGRPHALPPTLMGWESPGDLVNTQIGLGWGRGSAWQPTCRWC